MFSAFSNLFVGFFSGVGNMMNGIGNSFQNFLSSIIW